MVDIYDFYDRMERNQILLSFKGEVTSELLTSILQIIESKLDNMAEAPKTKRKVYNILVECLQNLYHHMDQAPLSLTGEPNSQRTAIFMIGKVGDRYNIITGNYILNENIEGVKGRIDKINSLDKDQLKEHYQEVLNNGQMSDKGGGGLGFIDIARKSGEKLDYDFVSVDEEHSFFTLNIKVAN